MSDSVFNKNEPASTAAPPSEKRAVFGKLPRAHLTALIVGGVILFLLGYFIAPSRREAPPSAPVEMQQQEPAQKIRYWTCSMHPQIKLPNPGKCPICFMDLVPVYETALGEDDESEGARLILSKTARELAEVETSLVEYRPLTLSVRMVGKIEYDETKLAIVSAWVGGRIDKLYVNFVGDRVSRGDRLTYVYSPELRTAQEEFLIAHRRWQVSGETGDTDDTASALAVKDATRKKLELWGILPEQIEELEQTGARNDHMTICAPISGTVITREAYEGQYVETGQRLFSIADLSEVWAQLDAYEIDLEWLQIGQTVTFETDVFPGELFKGRITFIQPILSETTRTVKVRVSVPNPGERLKPGMYVRARVDVALDEAALPVTSGAKKALSIPATAPLLTGTRAVVYVEDRKNDAVSYVGRQIELGPRTGDYYLVRSGLKEGESVVTRGNFKIDSALQIQAKPSMMKPEGGGGPVGHHHGGPPPQSDVRQNEKEAGTSVEHQQHEAAVSQSPANLSMTPAPARALDAAGGAIVHMQAVLEAYLDLVEALAADNAGNASKNIDALRSALANISMNGLSGETHDRFMRHLSALQQTVPAKTPEDIGAQRKLLGMLGKPVSDYLRSFSHGFTFSLYEIFCPMAFEGKGGTWLQEDSVVRNPYFGQAMLGCGEIRQEFKPISRER